MPSDLTTSWPPSACLRDSRQMQVAQQRPHPDNENRSRPNTTGPAPSQHELAHLGRGQAAQVRTSRRAILRQELARHIDVVANRRRGQPALLDQIGPVRGKQNLHRAVGHGRRADRGDPDFSQMIHSGATPRADSHCP